MTYVAVSAFEQVHHPIPHRSRHPRCLRLLSYRRCGNLSPTWSPSLRFPVVRDHLEESSGMIEWNRLGARLLPPRE